MSTNYDPEIFKGRSSLFAEDLRHKIHVENNEIPEVNFRSSYSFQPNIGEVLDGDNFWEAFHTSDHTDIDDTVVLEELDREYRRYVYKVEKPKRKDGFSRDMPFACHNGYFTGFEEAQYHQGHPYSQGWFNDVSHESTECFKDVMSQDLDDPWTSFEKELSNAHDKHNEAMHGKEEEDYMHIYNDNTTNEYAYPFPSCGPNVYEIKTSTMHFSNDFSPSSSQWAVDDVLVENNGLQTLSSCNETFSTNAFQGISIGGDGLNSFNSQDQQFYKQADYFAYDLSHYEEAQSNFNEWNPPINTKNDPLSKNNSGKYNNDFNTYDNHTCVFENMSTSINDFLSSTCEATRQSNSEDPVVEEPTGSSWTPFTKQVEILEQEHMDGFQCFEKTMRVSDDEGGDECLMINNEAEASARSTSSWQSTSQLINVESSTSSQKSVSSSTKDIINADIVESASIKPKVVVVEEEDQDDLDNNCQSKKCLTCGIQTPIMAAKCIASKVGSIFHHPSRTTTHESYSSNAINEGELKPSPNGKPNRAHRLQNKFIQTMKSVFSRRR